MMLCEMCEVDMYRGKSKGRNQQKESIDKEDHPSQEEDLEDVEVSRLSDEVEVKEDTKERSHKERTKMIWMGER